MLFVVLYSRISAAIPLKYFSAKAELVVDPCTPRTLPLS